MLKRRSYLKRLDGDGSRVVINFITVARSRYRVTGAICQNLSSSTLSLVDSILLFTHTNWINFSVSNLIPLIVCFTFHYVLFTTKLGFEPKKLWNVPPINSEHSPIKCPWQVTSKKMLWCQKNYKWYRLVAISLARPMLMYAIIKLTIFNVTILVLSIHSIMLYLVCRRTHTLLLFMLNFFFREVHS